ncbi:MAG TPA: hypothetical protein VFX97_10760 [Pyrinomonadaceae bacterium]|nr:hypothetical protein [Pyrinomonadaceae bacterium]
MKKLLLVSFTVLILSVASAATAVAQADQPTLQYDSLQITARTNNSYKGNYDVWSWVPRFEFTVNGPIPSGGQLYVEVQQPGGSAPWLKFDCDTKETQKGYWWRTGECGGREVEDKSILPVGMVNFAIKMRNELAGTDTTLFTGKMKVAKTLTNEVGPKAAQKFVYYVDHDWNLPIGYIYYTADSVYGWDYPQFNAAFWVRGEAYKVEPHLFYKGQEIGRQFLDGMQVGKASCGTKVENNTTHYVNDSMPQKAKWARVECSFYTVKQWDKTDGGKGQPNTNEMFKMASNPGEYEIKILWNNKLARSIKFTVGPDGKLDNGIATANKLGIDRVVVPVQVLGDQDGVWDKNAWKTNAFFGNPLTGFTWP